MQEIKKINLSLDKSQNDWGWIKAKDFMLFNPKESIKKGTVVKNVPMDKIEPKTKEIPSYELTEYKGGVKFRNGDILMARITPCLENGKISQVSILDYNEIGAGSTEFIVLREKEGISDKDFIYYLSNSEYFKEPAIKSMVGSSGRQRVQRDVVENLEIYVPPLETQKKIGKVLSFFDKKISLNKKINKNLDDILDSIFKENFIKEFDNDNNDWKIKNIGELPLIITDYVANGSFASLKENVTILDYEEYAYFIRNTDLKSKSFQKFVNKHSYDFLKKSSLFGNEVIISNVGDVGSVFLCPFLDKPMTLGNNMILVKSRDDAINLNFYLFLLFRSNYGQYLISTITAGSVQSKFNKTEFKSLELTMPNDELIIKFNNLVSPIFDYKNKISDEIVRLTKLRDTLLPKLMSGEIDVSEVNCDLELKYNYMKYLFNQIHTPMSKSVV